MTPRQRLALFDKLVTTMRFLDGAMHGRLQSTPGTATHDKHVARYEKHLDRFGELRDQLRAELEGDCQ